MSASLQYEVAVSPKHTPQHKFQYIVHLMIFFREYSPTQGAGTILHNVPVGGIQAVVANALPDNDNTDATVSTYWVELLPTYHMMIDFMEINNFLRRMASRLQTGFSIPSVDSQKAERSRLLPLILSQVHEFLDFFMPVRPRMVIHLDDDVILEATDSEEELVLALLQHDLSRAEQEEGTLGRRDPNDLGDVPDPRD